MAAYDYDLVIVGAGSGNMLVSDELSSWRIAIIEGDRFGGTCLNRGCIPSKMFVYTADVASTVQHAGRYGIKAKFGGADWPAIRDRVFGRIDPLHDGAVKYRRENGVDVYTSPGSFTGPGVLRVGDDEIRSTRFVLAAGSRPAIPDWPGLAEVPYYTSDNVMRLKSLPKSMIVLGCGYIGAEMSHIFGSLGTKITVVNRNQQLLALHDLDVSRRFTEVYQRRFDVRLASSVQRISATRHGVRVELATPAGTEAVDAEVLLVATGRVPNSDRLNVAAAGIAVDEHGHVKTDLSYATNVPGVWAFGDLANHFQLKHMANAEARLVRYNLLHPGEPRKSPFNGSPVGGLRRPADRFGRPDRASAEGQRAALYLGDPAVQRHRLRLGARGHHQLRQGAGRPGHQATAGRPHHRPAGVNADPAADPGHVPGQHRRPGRRSPVHPPGPHRGSRAGLAGTPPPGLTPVNLEAPCGG